MEMKLVVAIAEKHRRIIKLRNDAGTAGVAGVSADRSEAARKGWETRKANGWTPKHHDDGFGDDPDEHYPDHRTVSSRYDEGWVDHDDEHGYNFEFTSDGLSKDGKRAIAAKAFKAVYGFDPDDDDIESVLKEEDSSGGLKEEGASSFWIKPDKARAAKRKRVV